MKRRPRKGNRWQAKRFFLTKTYKDGLRQMIWSRRRLSGRAQHVGLRILDRFASTPTIFANLENLARECDMSRPTLRRYMQELSKAGLFRFDTPPYWKRKSGFATEISFPTKTVEKWLRDNGFLMTMERNLPWSKHEKVNKDGVSPSAKLQNTPSTMERNFRSFHKNEVASAERADPRLDGAGVAPPPRQGLTRAQAMARDGEKLGAKLFDARNPVGKWYPATTDTPADFPPGYTLGAPLVYEFTFDGKPKSITLTLAGFSTTSDTERHLLARWDDGKAGWVPISLTTPKLGGYDDITNTWCNATTERSSDLPDGVVLGARVRFVETPPEPNVFGTIIGFGIDEEVLGHVLVQYEDWDDADDKIWLGPSEVDLVSSSVFCIGDKALHTERDVGIVTRVLGDHATVKFKSGEYHVPLSSLSSTVATLVETADLPKLLKSEQAQAERAVDMRWIPCTPPNAQAMALNGEKNAAYQYRGGERVRHLKFGEGVTTCGGVDERGLVCVNFRGRGPMAVLATFLELIEPAPECSEIGKLAESAKAAEVQPVVFHVDDAVRHADRGLGIITNIVGDHATVAFESGEELTVPLSSLSPAT